MHWGIKKLVLIHFGNRGTAHAMHYYLERLEGGDWEKGWQLGWWSTGNPQSIFCREPLLHCSIRKAVEAYIWYPDARHQSSGGHTTTEMREQQEASLLSWWCEFFTPSITNGLIPGTLGLPYGSKIDIVFVWTFNVLMCWKITHNSYFQTFLSQHNMLRKLHNYVCGNGQTLKTF